MYAQTHSHTIFFIASTQNIINVTHDHDKTKSSYVSHSFPFPSIMPGTVPADVTKLIQRSERLAGKEGQGRDEVRKGKDGQGRDKVRKAGSGRDKVRKGKEEMK